MAVAEAASKAWVQEKTLGALPLQETAATALEVVEATVLKAEMASSCFSIDWSDFYERIRISLDGRRN